MSEMQIQAVQNTSIIDNVSLQAVQQTLTKIKQFQAIVQKSLKQNFDYGIVPGSQKPCLLKAGAEKIIMLLGLRSEFVIEDSVKDWAEGFFYYLIKCKLYKDDMLITEGMGSCSTKEKRYKNQDAFTLDNTVLKMAKKRALVDAALTVGSLSDIFTQDLDDIDIEGNEITKEKQQIAKEDDIITEAQRKRMFALAQGNHEIVKEVLDQFGYEHSKDVKKVDYEKICNKIEQRLQQGQAQ